MGKADVGAADEIYEVAQRRANAELEKMKNEMGAVVDESKALGWGYCKKLIMIRLIIKCSSMQCCTR